MSGVDLAAVAERLSGQYGLDPAAIGPTVLATALDDAARTLELAPAALVARLAEPACVTALFNALPVGLSWFDRDVAQLRSAAAWAVNRARPLRVLSAPCARGEEVWSLAAALLDAGFDPAMLQIVGIDAMRMAIERAESGCYAAGAAAPAAAERPWWLVESGQQLRVHPRLHAPVRFRTANLLDGALELGSFDLVFSRNFLIYLTPAARLQWIDRVAGMLSADARVYVAASEPLGSWSARFSACAGEVPGAFMRAATRSAVCAAPTPARVVEPVAPAPARGPRRVDPPVERPPAAVGVPTRSAVDAPDPRALADAGELDLAERHLAPRLRQRMPAARDLVTAALIALARGQAGPAEDALRRALYLEHHHAEAAELLAVLLDQRGESRGAERLRGRAGGGR